MKSFALFCVLFGAGSAYRVRDTPCPQVQVIKDFNLNKYLGAWNELQHYVENIDPGCDCIEYEYAQRKEGGMIVRNCCRIKGERKCLEGYGVFSTPEKPEARLNFTFSDSPPDESNYWILATDYDNYAVTYHCEKLKDKHYESAYILSRSREIPAKVKPEVDAVIDKYLNRKELKNENDLEACKTPFQAEKVTDKKEEIKKGKKD